MQLLLGQTSVAGLHNFVLLCSADDDELIMAVRAGLVLEGGREGCLTIICRWCCTAINVVEHTGMMLAMPRSRQGVCSYSDLCAVLAADVAM